MKNPETLATLTYKTQNGDKLNERPIMNEESRDKLMIILYSNSTKKKNVFYWRIFK
jgi:hypothetical protein